MRRSTLVRWYDHPESHRNMLGFGEAKSVADTLFVSVPVVQIHMFTTGSDFHFSCGSEVRQFRARRNQVTISLNQHYQREGFIFVFLPRVDLDHTVKVSVNGGNQRGLWNVVGNVPKKLSNGSPRLVGRVIRVAVVVHGDGRECDGQVLIDF